METLEPFTKVLNSIICDKDLSGTSFKVLSFLLSCANEERDGIKKAFPSLDMIADKTGIARRSVASSINKLIELGYISGIDKIKSKEGNPFYTNRYILNEHKKINQELIDNRNAKKEARIANKNYYASAKYAQ